MNLLDMQQPIKYVLLAGGRGRRLKQGNKALLPVFGSTVVEFIMNRLPVPRTQWVISSNSDQQRFESLGLEVVAEGVETDKHIDFLDRRGCHYLQGYMFAKPLPSDELMQLSQDPLWQDRLSNITTSQ